MDYQIGWVAFGRGMKKVDLNTCLVALSHTVWFDGSSLEELVKSSFTVDEKMTIYAELENRYSKNPYFRRCQDVLRIAGRLKNLALFERIARRCGSYTRRTELLFYSPSNPSHQPYIDALVKTTSREKFAVTLHELPFVYHQRIKMRMRAVEAALAVTMISRKRSRVIGFNGRDVMRLIGKCVLSTWTDEVAWCSKNNFADNKRNKVAAIETK